MPFRRGEEKRIWRNVVRHFDHDSNQGFSSSPSLWRGRKKSARGVDRVWILEFVGGVGSETKSRARVGETETAGISPQHCWVDSRRRRRERTRAISNAPRLTGGRGNRTANLHVLRKTTSREKCQESGVGFCLRSRGVRPFGLARCTTLIPGITFGISGTIRRFRGGTQCRVYLGSPDSAKRRTLIKAAAIGIVR